ncbi:MAG: CHAD domain-containing protein [Moorea sp. SIO2B7]|nr:CHAD domain-containing protein [Moorena sp. SIO2B7]
MKISQQNQGKTFGDWAYLAIEKHFNKIIKHEVEVLKDKDTEELHQMRVGMRRLRSAIAGFAPALDLPKAAGQINVGKVARTLGTLRDIDVMGEALQNKYKPTLPKAEKKELNKALKTLILKRKDAFNQVQSTLGNNLYKNLKQGFQDWLAHPSYQEIAARSIKDVLPELLLPEVCRLLLHPGWLVGVELENQVIKFPDGLNHNEVEQLLDNQGLILHDLRKEAKRVRYNMELFTQFYGQMYNNYVKEVKAIQTVIGEIQDCFVLAEFLAQVFESDIQKKVPTLIKQFKATRYHQWKEWEVIQRKFLNPKKRPNLRLIVQSPILEESLLEDYGNSR